MKIISVPFKEKVAIFSYGDAVRKNKTVDIQTITEMLENIYRVDGNDVDGGVVIDIGSNIGIFSVFAVFMNSPRVLSFEPNISNYDFLQKNVYLNNCETRIETINLAVMDKPGKYNISDEDANSRIGSDGDECTATTIEEIFKGHKLEVVNVLKCDIEGSEYHAFYVPKDIMERIKYITMEFHPTNILNFGSLIGKLSETHRVEILGSYKTGGFIYARGN